MAVAMITPGPIVITSGFIGYLVAGAPHYRRFARNPQVKAFVQGVTAAAVGAIAGAAIILSKRALVDITTVVLAAISLVTLLRFKRVPEWVEFLAERRKIGPNFNPQVGFLERVDCVCDYADLIFKPRPKIHGVRELNFEGFLFHAPDTHGVLQTQEWQTTFRADFHSGAYTDDDIVAVVRVDMNVWFIAAGGERCTRAETSYGKWEAQRPLPNGGGLLAETDCGHGTADQVK